MANLFVNLPVPAANAAGAAVDVTLLGGEKTVTLQGSFKGAVTIQISNDPAALIWAPLITFQNKGELTTTIACMWMRAKVSGYKSGTADCDVGSNDDGTQIANLPCPPADGVGAAVDITNYPSFKTVIVGDTFRGTVIIEFSEDNIAWSQVLAFTRPGQVSRVFTAKYMRVRRTGVPGIAPGLPQVDIGASSGGSGGGGGGGGNVDRFTFTAAAASSDFFVTLPVARATDNYTVQATCGGVPAIYGIDCPNLAPTDRTTTQFRVVLTTATVIGDQIDFEVGEKT